MQKHSGHRNTQINNTIVYSYIDSFINWLIYYPFHLFDFMWVLFGFDAFFMCFPTSIMLNFPYVHDNEGHFGISYNCTFKHITLKRLYYQVIKTFTFFFYISEFSMKRVTIFKHSKVRLTTAMGSSLRLRSTIGPFNSYHRQQMWEKKNKKEKKKNRRITLCNLNSVAVKVVLLFFWRLRNVRQ